jgi:hypothetical protein
MNLRALLCGLLIFASTAVATAETKIKVAVIPGVAVNIDAARVDALSQDMADALEAELVIDAIGGLEVRRLLPADGLPADCVANAQCVADVGKRTGAAQLLFVVMVDAGGAVQIDTTWVDPATNKQASRPAIDIAVLSEAKARFASSATTLLPDAPVRPKPKTGGGIDGKMTKAVPRHFTTTSFITTGVAVAGLGLGIGFAIRTKGLYGDCDKPEAPCDGTSREDKIRTSALIADLGFVAALGGAVATAILYATSGSESRLVVAPNAESGGGVSLTAIGSF